jgi:Transglutaminase-like domain
MIHTRRVFALLLLLLFAGCAVEPAWDNFHYSAAIPVEAESLDDLLLWCMNNISYRSDEEVYGKSYWQTPEETYRLRTGDCEDFALLFMYLTERTLRLETELIIVGYNSTSANHVVVGVGGEWYETTGGFRIIDRSPYTYITRVDFETSMWQSATYHSGLL